MVAQQTGTPRLSGMVPPLAELYYPRKSVGLDVTSLHPGQTVVLAHGEQTAAPAAQGGTGKTQLAVEFAENMWKAQAVELLVWVAAASREAVLTGFTSAADLVGACDPDEAAEGAAARFVAWLARTRRPWAMVIDDLADAADLEHMWPSGPAGQVVITTRLPGAALNRAAPNLSIVPVGGFHPREAVSYLSAKLSGYVDQRIEALDLCEDLDGLPLAIAQAADVVNTRGLSCRDYRVQLAERREHMSGVTVAGLSTEVLSTWSLAVECAQDLSPGGVAWRALALTASLDPHGIPSAVLTSPAACGYVLGRPGAADRAGQNQVHTAFTHLARLGLVSIDAVSAVPMIRMHPSVRAAVRAYLPRANVEPVVRAAADALAETWQQSDSEPHLNQAMRNCVSALTASDRELLWKPQAHPLLFRAGLSLEDSRLTDSAVAYWQSMVATSTGLLGPADASALVAQERLAAAFEAAGRVNEAIAALEGVLGDREKTQGPEHPQTIAARGHLAHAYQLAGRFPDAVTLYKSMVAGFDRQLGWGHPDTRAARASLADAYQQAGMMKDALSVLSTLLTDTEQLFGAGDPATLAAQASLAEAYQSAGQPKDAIKQYKRSLASQQRMNGRDHPDTIAARANLASALRRAGELKDAISQYEQVLADQERAEGADHPDTIAARANLAFAYRSAGQLRLALPAYERTLTDRERLQGPDHKDTRTARSNLAGAYQQVGRFIDAIAQYERLLADSERILGPGSVETLTARSNFASALYAEGRLMEAVDVLEGALADCERHLGPSHPMTKTVRENLTAATQT